MAAHEQPRRRTGKPHVKQENRRARRQRRARERAAAVSTDPQARAAMQCANRLLYESNREAP